jgi:hypothetical protein
MKRGTPEHPKVVRFAKLLRVRRHVAVGLLEMLWHLTARYTPAGDVGKWSDEEIATALDWDGDPARLLQAFVVAGLLEPHPTHRLIVHDWAEHADDGVRLLLKRRGQSFVTCRNPYLSEHVATCRDILPLPLPLPEPQPRSLSVRVSAPRATQWPEDFTLTLERADVARTLRVDAAAEWAKFKDHALKDGTTHKNWDAAWRYWCRRAPEFQRRQMP